MKEKIYPRSKDKQTVYRKNVVIDLKWNMDRYAIDFNY